MNYTDTKIYKLECNVTGKVYIGSTSRKYLSERLCHHRRDYELYKQGKCGYITSFKVLENNDYDIVLIVNQHCNDKNERNALERHYIETIECVNKNHPGRTRKEYEIINKDTIKANKKKYQEDHKEETKLYKKEYYEKNKDKILAKTNCPICNITVNNLCRHLKTKKHIENSI